MYPRYAFPQILSNPLEVQNKCNILDSAVILHVAHGVFASHTGRGLVWRLLHAWDSLMIKGKMIIFASLLFYYIINCSIELKKMCTI